MKLRKIVGLPIEGEGMDPDERNANLRATVAASGRLLEARVKTDENLLRATQVDNTAALLEEVRAFKRANPRLLVVVTPDPQS